MTALVNRLEERTFLLCCRLKSCRTCSDLLSGHPRPSRVRAPVYRGCPCRDSLGCSHIQGDVTTKRQPFACWLESCCSVIVVVVVVVVFHAQMQLRTLTLSIVFILSHLHEFPIFLQSFGGLWVFFSMKLLIDMLSTSFEISSHFSCLFTLMQICSTSRRLINFECCRVCPWSSLRTNPSVDVPPRTLTGPPSGIK